MGIALRMAALMRLHREEEYHLASDAPNEEVIRAESARRTLVCRTCTSSKTYNKD